MEQPGEGLHGFAEAHVVREHAAEALRGEMGEELKAFELVGTQRCLQVGGQSGGRQGGDAGGAVLQSVDKQGVARGEGLGFERKLQDVETVFGGTTAGEHIVHPEPEAIKRSGGGCIGGDLGRDFAPAVARKVHPFATGF